MKNSFVVYTKPSCPFCIRAKELIESKGDDAEFIDVSKNPEQRQYLLNEGFKTVPQIFLSNTGDHIGGFVDLDAWYRSQQ